VRGLGRLHHPISGFEAIVLAEQKKLKNTLSKKPRVNRNYPFDIRE
jgi:hypothetical protein